MTQGGDEGKWWRRVCGNEETGDEGKWWLREAVTKGSGDEGNAAKRIIAVAAWMLHGLCFGEEAGARNLVFFRVKWLQAAMKGTSRVRRVRLRSVCLFLFAAL